MENMMNEQIKLILALQQVENVSKLLKDGQYAGFFSSHLFPIKFEIERQLANLTNTNCYTKMTK
jgi:predicted RNA-binding protein with EMAP domain